MWSEYEAKMKAKREINNRNKARGRHSDKAAKQEQAKLDELIVQLLSHSVEGKAQKFQRIGPKEFVPFKESDLTVKNIKAACLEHFNAKGVVQKGMQIDILAGDRGPSCLQLAQIPDLKLIHARLMHQHEYIESSSSEPEDMPIKGKSTKRPTKSAPLTPVKVPKSLRVEQNVAKDPAATAFPKSLSISAMLGLGELKKSVLTVIDVYDFDVELMSWSVVPQKAEFMIEKSHFGEGGFRRAYKATSNSERFKGGTWVVKKYLTNALELINTTNQTEEMHTKKIVQTHVLAKNLATQLEARAKNTCAKEYGKTLSYNNVVMGKVEDTGDYVTIEDFVEGAFFKYVNNDGAISSSEDEICLKAQCLSHYSYEKTDRKLMLVDIQGAATKLFDPEIASAKLISDRTEENLFCNGNLSSMAIENFVEKHTCNKYCVAIGLSALK